MLLTGFDQALSHPFDALAPSQLASPRRRDGGEAVERAGKLPGDGSGGVGIFAEVSGEEHRAGKVARASHRPQRCFERVRDVAR